MIKVLAVFYIILAIAWHITAYKEPKEVTTRITRRAFPKEAPYNFPSDYLATHNELAVVFRDATGRFNSGNVPVLALPPFVMASGDTNPALLSYITESAFSYLYNDSKIKVVRRDYDSGNRSRIKANYIIIGRLSTIRDQIRVTVRIQDINTGEILDSFDSYIDREKVSKFL